jgi:hypothetical protein
MKHFPNQRSDSLDNQAMRFCSRKYNQPTTAQPTKDFTTMPDAIKAAMEEPIEDSYRPIPWLVPLNDEQVRTIMQILPDSVMDLRHERCRAWHENWHCNEDAVWEHVAGLTAIKHYYCTKHSIAPGRGETRLECEITEDAIRRHGGDTPELHEHIRTLVRAAGKQPHDCYYCFRVTGCGDQAMSGICDHCLNA